MPSHLLLPMLLLLVAGMFNSLQAPANALLARTGGSALIATAASFLVGMLILFVAILAVRPQANWAALRALPPYAWTGGLYGAIYVGTFALVTHRLGIAAAIVIASLGQLTSALLIDHFALFGVPRDPITVTRVAGVLLVIAGIALVRWR